MKHIRSIRLNEVSREELLPGFSADFPYIATRAELGSYEVPWHWHKTAELFIVESGTVEYTTPGGSWRFPAGCGGYLNPNVLHRSRVVPGSGETVQLLHLFAPALLSGGAGNRLEQKFILPLTASPLELLPLDAAEQGALLAAIHRAFALDDDAWGYEFSLREELTAIWRQLLVLARPYLQQTPRVRESDGQIKSMLRYINEHYAQDIPVDRLAEAGHVSRRTCFRLFRETLHMPPLEVMRGLRLQEAARLLAESDRSVTDIALSCGFDSASYFGKLFAERYGCPPGQYRKMARS